MWVSYVNGTPNGTPKMSQIGPLIYGITHLPSVGLITATTGNRLLGPISLKVFLSFTGMHAYVCQGSTAMYEFYL